MVRRLLVALFLLVVGSQAWASFTMPSGQFKVVNSGSAYTNLCMGAVCTASTGALLCSQLNQNGYTWTFTNPPMRCNAYQGAAGPLTTMSVTQLAAACPANSTDTGGGQCTCNSGYDESGSSCVPHVNQCTDKATKPAVIRWVIGWTRTPNDSDSKWIDGPSLPPSNASTICEAGCAVGMNPIPKFVGRSQTPAPNGLYRTSGDFEGVYTGAECTAAADARNNPAAPEPACPGYVGEINGVNGCYGTAEKPVGGVEAPNPGHPLAGNPPSGKVPDADVGKLPAERTPTSGNGGNAGGPASAAVGGKGGAAGGSATGTGTVASPGEGEEQAACGAPGQPKCAIDEGDTAKDAGTSFDGAKGELDTNKTSAQDAINSAHQIAAPTWSFSFQLPTGCTSYQVGQFKGLSFSFDPCQYQGVIHDLMSMIWAAVTAFCLITMVGRAIQES